MHPPRNPHAVRKVFLIGLLRGIRATWPILSLLIATMLVLGAIIGSREGWRFLDGLYFAFVTGLTVGYGDLVPKQVLSRLLAIIIAFSGILLTGLVAAISVQALQHAMTRQPTNSEEESARE